MSGARTKSAAREALSSPALSLAPHERSHVAGVSHHVTASAALEGLVTT